MPKGRAEAIRKLAQEVARGRICLEASVDVEETKRQLEELPGIGSWTAEYIALRALGAPDAKIASRRNQSVLLLLKSGSAG